MLEIFIILFYKNIAFKVSAAAHSDEPIARNTFIITRPHPSQKNYADDDEVENYKLINMLILNFINNFWYEMM